MRLIFPWPARPAAILAVAAITVSLQPASAQLGGFGGGGGGGGGGYSGPSLLSRGGNSPGSRGRSPADLTFYAVVRGTYETGLIGPAPPATPATPALAPGELPANVDLPRVSAAGVQAEVGIYGGHTWSKSTLGVDYRGDIRRATSVRASRFNGSSHALALQYNYQISNRVALGVSESAGTTNRAFGGFVAPAFAETDRPGIPLNEFFDSRIYFSQTTATLGYLKSARTIFTVSGGQFFVKRSNRNLLGLQGYRLNGSAEYRLDRYNSIGIHYNFTHFGYPRVAGRANLNSVALQYSRQVSRNLFASILGGITRSDTIGTQLVMLNPEIAFILGRTTGFEVFNRLRTRPRFEAQAIYTLERSSLRIHVAQGVSPGNGIYQTTQQRVANVGYSYSGVKDISMGLSLGYSTHTSLAQDIAGFRSFRAGAGMQYRLAEYIQLSTQFDYRSFRSPGQLTGREGYSVAIGLSYSPSHFPLAIW